MNRVSDDRIEQLRCVRKTPCSGLQSGTALIMVSDLELRSLADEVRDHRAAMARLAAWAEDLRRPGPDGTTGVGPFIAQELENRIAGGAR